MSFLPADKDRPRRGPMGPLQGWADAHPVQALLLNGLLVAVALTLAVVELLEDPPDGPQYFLVALFATLGAQAAWTMWRQYERSKTW